MFFKFGLAAELISKIKKKKTSSNNSKRYKIIWIYFRTCISFRLSIRLDACFTLGPLPTNGLAMLTKSMKANMGIMITASHNPYYDNGLKLFGPDGMKLSDKIEKKIENL